MMPKRDQSSVTTSTQDRPDAGNSAVRRTPDRSNARIKFSCHVCTFQPVYDYWFEGSENAVHINIPVPFPWHPGYIQPLDLSVRAASAVDFPKATCLLLALIRTTTIPNPSIHDLLKKKSQTQTPYQKKIRRRKKKNSTHMI